MPGHRAASGHEHPGGARPQREVRIECGRSVDIGEQPLEPAAAQGTERDESAPEGRRPAERTGEVEGRGFDEIGQHAAHRRRGRSRGSVITVFGRSLLRAEQ
jgi:hypothetical protein